MVLLEGGHPEKGHHFCTYMFVVLQIKTNNFVLFYFISFCSCGFQFFTSRYRWRYDREAIFILATTFLLLYVYSFAMVYFCIIAFCIIHFSS